MTKAELVEAVCQRLGLPRKEAMHLVNQVFDLMRDALVSGDKVKISGFGNFIVREKHARKGRNPLSGEPLIISARKVLVFKPSQILKKAINEGNVRTEE